MKKFSKFAENRVVIPSIGLFTLENSCGMYVNGLIILINSMKLESPAWT